MKNRFWTSFLLSLSIFTFLNGNATSQSALDKLLPVRAFCIAAPKPDKLDLFVKFINEELSLNKINTLILRIDFNYQFESHPELRDSGALSKSALQQMVQACKQNNIRLIPQINLLGHQSWATKVTNLLKVYPQFDETPHVQMPEQYVWPNADSLYCKSYCPLHPDVHTIVFDLMDEICDVFETNAFHAGMDEVFYIGDAKCPRCAGKNKAVLFADEVNKIQNHLAQKNRNLWIWGDRLIDGRATGIGEWEGSFNDTYGAVNLISKKVIICDWHYEKAEQTAVYFANKGLNVITCAWRNPAIASIQTQDMVKFRKTAKSKTKKHYRGIMQTIWTGAAAFLDEYYAAKGMENNGDKTQANSFKAITGEINKLEVIY